MGARKRQTRQQGTGQTTALVARREQVQTAQAFVAKFSDRVGELIGRDPARFIRTMSVAIAQNPDLAQCTQASLIGGMLQIAALKLEVGVAGQAWLIPFKKHAQVVIGYKGLLTMAHRSGRVGSIKADVVYEKDRFGFKYGLDRYCEHEFDIDLTQKQRGKMRAAYAVAHVYVEGQRDQVFDVMSADEVRAIEARSPAARAGSSPWKTDPAEMWKKTVLRRLCKVLPMSIEDQHWIGLDEAVDANVDQGVRVYASDLPDTSLFSLGEGGEEPTDAGDGTDAESGDGGEPPDGDPDGSDRPADQPE